MKKKILSLVLISLLTACSFMGQVDYIYAVDPPPASMSEQDMVDAFLAYARSRNVHIDGSLLASVTTFTTQTYNSICRKLGINPTTLQAELHKVFDLENNRLLYYSFSALGINQFNRIFAQFLLDNDIEVGDELINFPLYSGYSFTDDDGNYCLIYVLYNGLSSQTDSTSNIHYMGTSYKYTSSRVYENKQSEVWNFNINNHTYNINAIYAQNSNVGHQYVSGVYNGRGSMSTAFMETYIHEKNQQYGEPDENSGSGESCIIYVESSQKYYLGTFGFVSNLYKSNVYTWDYKYNFVLQYELNLDTTPVSVTVNTPDDKQVLPAPSDDEPINISPDGNTDQEPDEPDDPTPVVPPGGTTPDWTIPDGNITPDGDGGYNFDWDFQLPDLDIDWSINGLKDKFPFCIPFDFINLISVLNVEPQAPRIVGTVNLLVYQWNIDFDFSQFDNIALIARNLIFIGFCLGLILITRRLIKG